MKFGQFINHNKVGDYSGVWTVKSWQIIMLEVMQGYRKYGTYLYEAITVVLAEFFWSPDHCARTGTRWLCFCRRDRTRETLRTASSLSSSTLLRWTSSGSGCSTRQAVAAILGQLLNPNTGNCHLGSAVESKYPPSWVSCWIYVTAIMGQLLNLSNRHLGSAVESK